MNDVINRIYTCGIVPVIKLDKAEDALPLCKALLDGGVDVAEITCRTDAAEQAIANVCKSIPEILVGAGTVLSVEMAKKVVDAGAGFIATPGFNPKVVEYCLNNNITIIPGCSNPTDIEIGLDYGLRVLKFFPAESCGGIKAIEAMSAPYSMVKFMPTGGINANLLTDYLSSDKVIACGGSWMVNDAFINMKYYDLITSLTSEAVAKVHGFTFTHLGIYPDKQNNALKMADMLNNIFSIEKKELPNSFFVGSCIEIMKDNSKELYGHIGIKTNNVKRAIAYLSKKGIDMDFSTLKGSTENPELIYLKNNIGPFAVHIMH